MFPIPFILIVFIPTIMSQAAVNEDITFGCMLICGDSRIIPNPPRCFMTQDECAMALSTEASACFSSKELLDGMLIIPTPIKVSASETLSAACAKFYSFLTNQNTLATSLASKTSSIVSEEANTMSKQIDKANCGCTDLIETAFNGAIESVIGDSLKEDSFCDAMFEFLASKPREWACKKTQSIFKTFTLLGDLCEMVFDVGANIVKSGFTPICGMALSLIEQTLGISVENFFQKAKLKEAVAVSKLAKATCGFLLCGKFGKSNGYDACSTENVIKNGKSTGGVIAVIVTEITQAFCSLTSTSKSTSNSALASMKNNWSFLNISLFIIGLIFTYL